MDDLISRQAAIEAIGEKPFAGTADEYDYEQGLQNQWERDVVAIKILPPAQPEIIRCKDCKHRGTDDCPMYFVEWIEWDDDGYTEYDDVVTDNTTDDGFCNYGERKEEHETCGR